MRSIRFFTLSILFPAIAGCKIIQIVPEGGYIQSRTGTGDCMETNCEIDVENGTTYSDTFTAVAHDGYSFSHWKQADQYLCGGSSDPCALEGISAQFTSQDIDLYLEPVFEVSPNENPMAGTRPLNDTGLIWGGNYPSGNNTDCTGETVQEQDCAHGRDLSHNDDTDGAAGFSFTKLDADGSDLSADASSWSCVRDNVTGLVWEAKTEDGGIHDKNNRYRWGGIGADSYGDSFYDDWDSLVNGSNSETLCGYSDWRVPRIEELKGIVNFSQFEPATDSHYFPNIPALTFWSSSAYAGHSDYAWYVAFRYGQSDHFFRSGNRRVVLVRGGQ